MRRLHDRYLDAARDNHWPLHASRRFCRTGFRHHRSLSATIVYGSTIGEYAFVGAGAVVNRDVPAFALIVGVPGRQVGWMSRFGERLDLPLTGDGVAVCLHTGDRYVLRAGVCRISDESTKRSHAHAD